MARRSKVLVGISLTLLCAFAGTAYPQRAGQNTADLASKKVSLLCND